MLLLLVSIEYFEKIGGFNPNGKKSVNGVKLSEEGFNFHYFTNVYSTKKGMRYYFCYDYGYIKLEDNQFILVQKQQYIQ